MARRNSYSAFSYWNMKSNLFALLTVLFLLSFHYDGNGSTLSYFSLVIGKAPWKAENFPFLLYVIFPLEIMPWKIVCAHNRLVDRFERFFFRWNDKVTHMHMHSFHPRKTKHPWYIILCVLQILLLSIPYIHIIVCFHSTYTYRAWVENPSKKYSD